MKTIQIKCLLYGMTAITMVAALSSAITMIASFSPATAREPEPRDAFQKEILPLLEHYCVDCHMNESSEAGIVLDRFENQEAAVKAARTWLRVRDALQGRIMPPADMPQPSLEELDRIIAWVEKDVLAAQCAKQVSSTPVVIRRLNRQEYNNTIRDLLGSDLHLADAFPPDDIGFGFDNVGSALNISPIHVEKYLDAAELALQKAIVLPDAEAYSPAELIGLKTYPLPPNGAVEFKHSLKPGRYLADFSLVRVGIPESVPPPRLVIGFGKDRRTVDAVRVQDETVVYRYWLKVAAGDNLVHVALAPGQSQDPNVVRAQGGRRQCERRQALRGRNGLACGLDGRAWPRLGQAQTRLPESHRRILFCTPEYGDSSRIDCARQVIARFAERAFRRPVQPDEVERILQIFRLAHDRGESYERAVQVALTTVLASPKFLFLVEPEEAHVDRPLTEFELASRLSYFLWSSMPDDELFREARGRTLRTHLRRQVVRMLDDPRSDAFVENFAGQWLQLRKLAGVARDKDLFPGFDDTLREAMRRRPSSSSRTSCATIGACWNCWTPTTLLLMRHWRDIMGSKGSRARRSGKWTWRIGGGVAC